MISQGEIFILNRYAAAELAGALLLGRMARKVNDPALIISLTRHAMEEMRHALAWYELIRELQLPFLDVHDQKSYFMHAPKDPLDFLAFTHIFELRVPFHFNLHAAWTHHSSIRKVLLQLAREEDGHLSWIRAYLQERIKKGEGSILSSLKKFSDLEQQSYDQDLAFLEKQEGAASFVKVLRDHLSEFNSGKKWWQ